MPIDVALFNGIEMFELLHEDDRQAVADVVDVVTLESGQTLFQAGEPGDRCTSSAPAKSSCSSRTPPARRSCSRSSKQAKCSASSRCSIAARARRRRLR